MMMEDIIATMPWHCGERDWVKQANQSMSEAAQYNFAN